MGYPGYAFIDTGVLLRWVLAGVVLWLCCWCACYGAYAAWVKTLRAWRRRRAETALRAEVTRGLAEIELFLGARSAPAVPGQPPDNDGDDRSPG